MTREHTTGRARRYSARLHEVRERHVFDFTGPEVVHQTVRGDDVVAEERFENPVPAMVADFEAELGEALRGTGR